jgi:hypothetical protein
MAPIEYRSIFCALKASATPHQEKFVSGDAFFSALEFDNRQDELLPFSIGTS